jgi:hypothetical protein
MGQPITSVYRSADMSLRKAELARSSGNAAQQVGPARYC